MSTKSTWLIVLILAIIAIDQVTKIWIKTHLLYGEMIPIFGQDWAYIHFVENEGMAFGKQFNIPYGKLILSLFRLFAAGVLVLFLRNLLQANAGRGVLASFGLILAGAVGNIIDSVFYGVIFSASYSHGLPAELFPDSGGYSSFLHGRVVDMFYFPLFQTTFPDWLPVWGGRPFLFFGPVFNVADVAISWGVLQILIFHRQFFHTKETEENEVPGETAKMD